MHNLVDRLCFTAKKSLRNAFLAAVRPIPSTFLLSTQSAQSTRYRHPLNLETCLTPQPLSNGILSSAFGQRAV
jgi:hypothetical protein